MALESAKRKCMTYYTRGIDLGDEYMQYWNDACLNDCNGNGTCVNGKVLQSAHVIVISLSGIFGVALLGRVYMYPIGDVMCFSFVTGTCECNSGLMSGDCSLSSGNNNPPVTIMDESSLCDTRLEDCQFATIYGRNFPTTGLACDVTSASVRSSRHNCCLTLC